MWNFILLFVVCSSVYSELYSQTRQEFDFIFTKSQSLYENMQIDSTLICISKLKNLLRTLDSGLVDERKIHRLHFMEGRSLSLNQQYDESNEVWSKFLLVLNSGRKTNYNKKLEILNEIASNYFYKGSRQEMNNAIESIDQHLEKDFTYSYSNLAKLAQIRGQYESFANNYSGGLSHLKEALCLHQMSPDTTSAQMISCISEMSNFYAYMGRPRDAIAMSLYAQAKASQSFGSNSFKSKKYSNNIGLDYFQLQEYEKSEFYLKDYVQAMKDQYGEDHISLVPSYINLGLLNSQRKISSALNYFHAAERLYTINNKSASKKQATLFINLAVLYLQLGDQKKGLDYVKKLEDLAETSDVQFTSYRALAYQLRGEAQIDAGDFENAVANLILVQKIYEINPPPNKLRIVENYSAMTRAYFWQEDYDKSMYYADLTLSFAEELNRPTRVIQSTIKKHSALIAMSMEQWEQALLLNKEALALLYADIDNNDFRNVNKLSHLVFLLEDLLAIELAYYTATPTRNIKPLKQAFYTGKSALYQSIDQMSADDDRHELKKIIYSLSEQLLSVSYTIQQVDQTFDAAAEALEIMELNKSNVLVTGIRTDHLFSSRSNIPTIVKNEITWRKKTDHLRVRLESTHATEHEAINTLRDTLLKIEEQHQIILDDIRNNQPKIHNLLYGMEIATMDDIRQTLLSAEDILFQYFVGDSIVSRLTITKDSAYIQNICHASKLKQLINQWRHFAQNPNSDVSALHNISCDLSNILLDAPILIESHYTNLIIINDGVGNYLPFESLPVDCSSNLYVNDLFNVSYEMSSTLALERNALSTKRSCTFTGFAASYDKDIPSDNYLISMRSGSETKYNLPFAVDEISTISTLVNGKSYINQFATETAFKSVAQSAGVVHLSLHGELSDLLPMESGLLFNNTDSLNDGLLSSAEIYNLNMTAEMAVLSACETGVGPLKRGEGLQSVARAFAYSGVNSTVMSLWEVPDLATKKIMVAFYEGLKNGLRKDEALRQAKLHYLARTIEPQERHPYYWAGFVAQGNMSPLKFSSSGNRWLWTLGIFACIGLVFMLFKVVKKRA